MLIRDFEKNPYTSSHFYSLLPLLLAKVVQHQTRAFTLPANEGEGKCLVSNHFCQQEGQKRVVMAWRVWFFFEIANQHYLQLFKNKVRTRLHIDNQLITHINRTYLRTDERLRSEERRVASPTNLYQTTSLTCAFTLPVNEGTCAGKDMFLVAEQFQNYQQFVIFKKIHTRRSISALFCPSCWQKWLDIT